MSWMVENALDLWETRLEEGGVLGDYDEFEEKQIISSLENIFDPIWGGTQDQLDRAAALVELVTPQIEARGSFERWSDVLEAATNAVIPKLRLRAIVWHNYARSLIAQGEFRDGEAAYLKAIQMTRRAEDYHNLGRAYSNLGYHYISRGHWWRGEILNCLALPIFEQVGYDHGLAVTLNQLGALYTRQRRYETAHQYIAKACGIWQNKDDGNALLWGYLSLSLLYHNQADGANAVKWANEALRLSELAEDKSAMIRCKINVGIGYIVSKAYGEAITVLEDALTIAKGQNDDMEEARARYNLGEAYLMAGDWQQGIQHIDIALDGLDNADLAVDILRTLLDYYLDQKQEKLSLETLDRLIGVVHRHHWGIKRRNELHAMIDQYKADLA